MTTFFGRHKQFFKASLWIAANTANNTAAGALGSSFVKDLNTSELVGDMALGAALVSFLCMARPMGSGLRRYEWKWDSDTF